MSFLKVNKISVVEEGNTIIQNISFDLKTGQKIAIAGETGSGKSTLLQTIAGLIQPKSGEVFFESIKVEGPHDKLVPGHPEIAYLSQQFELPQFLRVEQVLKYSNTLSDEEARTLYDVCRISHLAKRRTNQLSGGERQRIALARLLGSWPSLLLLDEPFSNLDMGHKNILKSVIRDIGDELGVTCILISHDPLDTLSWADEILVIQSGKLIQKGTPQQIYKQPVNEYAASLFGNYNLIPSATANTIFKLPVSDQKAVNLLIRPESIKLTSEENGMTSGVVHNVRYFGSYYEIEVLIVGVSVKVKALACDVAAGDTVYLELADSAVWWV